MRDGGARDDGATDGSASDGDSGDGDVRGWRHEETVHGGETAARRNHASRFLWGMGGKGLHHGRTKERRHEGTKQRKDGGVTVGEKTAAVGERTAAVG